MSTQPEQAQAEILQQIVASIREKVPEDRRDQVEEFARQYYQRLSPEDLLALEPEDPYGPVKALQAAFDPSVLNFADEYYETLGIGRE